MFVDHSALLWETDPDKLTPEMLDKISEHLIQKALAGKSQAVIDQARRRLEAGQPVTVEAMNQYAAEEREGASRVPREAALSEGA